MGIFHSLQGAAKRLLALSALSLASMPVYAVPIQPEVPIFIDQQLQSCFDEEVSAHGWTATEQVNKLECSDRGIESVEGIQELVNLVELNLSENRIDYLPSLNLLQQLKSLNFNHNRLTDIHGLQGLIGLTQLNLSGNRQLDPVQVKELIQGNRGLTHIGVGHIAMGDLAWLTSWDFDLQELDVSYTGIKDLPPIHESLNFRVLRAAGNKLHHVWLDSLQSIEIVDLSHNRLTDLHGLQELTGLTQLNLTGNRQLDPLRVNELIQGNPGLTHIGVGHIAMGDLGWLSWWDFDLQDLDISYTGINYLPSMERYPNLRVLRAAGNQLDFASLDNPSNETLDLKILDLSHNYLSDIHGSKGLTGLTQLNLTGNRQLEPFRVKELIQNNPGLTHIGVGHITMGDLGWLSWLDFDLQELDVSYTGIKNLPPMYGYPNLQVLRAAGNQLDYVSLDNPWNETPDLKILDLSHNRLTDTYDLQGLAGLSQLNLTGNRQLELIQIKALIQNNPGLTHIGVGHIAMGDLGWLSSWDFDLQELDVSYTGINDLPWMDSYPNLRVLRAAGNQLQDVWFDASQPIEVIDVSHNRLTDIHGLQGLTGLAQLNLTGNRQLDPIQVKELIQNNPRLTHIGVGHIAMGDLGWLSWDYDLQELDVSYTGINDLPPLYGSPNLRVVRAAGNQLQYVWLDSLQPIEIVDFSHNRLTDIHGLQGLSGLTQLNLTGNRQLDPIQVKELIQNNPRLTHIGVGHIAMGDLDWLLLTGHIGRYNLNELDVSYTGVEHLWLTGHPNLRVLRAAGNGLRSFSLGSLSSLEIVDLSFNQLASISGLEGQRGLTQLNLSGNARLARFEVSEIKELIQSNPRLTHIGLSHIAMDYLGWLPWDFDLQELDVSYTGIKDLPPMHVYPNLQVVRAAGNQLRYASLDSSQPLEVIDLSHNRLTDLHGLQGQVGLTQLNLTGNRQLDPLAVRVLIEQNPGLTHIGVGGIAMGDLSWLPARGYYGEYDLQALDIRYTGHAFDLNPLVEYSNLKILMAGGNQLQDIWALSYLQQLEMLDLSHNDIQFVLNLSELVGLTSLDLRGNQNIKCSELDELVTRLSTEVVSRPQNCI